jgi:hypothetical protein
VPGYDGLGRYLVLPFDQVLFSLEIGMLSAA